MLDECIKKSIFMKKKDVKITLFNIFIYWYSNANATTCFGSESTSIPLVFIMSKIYLILKTTQKNLMMIIHQKGEFVGLKHF